MKKSIFAVCDPEVSYACNLSGYLNEKKTIPFEVQAFTDVEHLQNFAQKNEIEILLISSRAMSEEVRELPIGRTILLSEGEKLSDPDLPFVYKYQSSDDILSEIMEVYAKDHPQTQMYPFGMKKTKLYGIYSPVGRTRKTSFALTLGEILAESKKVLYLNFEEFSGFEELFQVTFRMDLADLLYFFRQEDGALLYKLNSAILTFHALEYIPPARSPADLQSIGSREWLDFLQEVISFREYDVILLDLSWRIEELHLILNACDRIYMPAADDLISQAKLRQYERLLQILKMEEVLQKTIRIHPPMQPILRGNGDILQQLLWGEMGSFVRRLLLEEGDQDG